MPQKKTPFPNSLSVSFRDIIPSKGWPASVPILVQQKTSGTSTKVILEYLIYLENEVEAQRRKPNFPQDSELQNEIDNIANLINTTLYKLRFLK